MDLSGEKKCDHIAGDPPTSFTLSGCPKCLGKGVYGDISFNTLGKIETVNGVDQLNQQIKKVIVENTRDTGYGFNYKLITESFGKAQELSLKRELNRCLTYLNNTQINAKKNGFFYKVTEELYSVDRIDIFRDTDPRTINALVYCKSVSGADITLTIPLGKKASFKLTPMYVSESQTVVEIIFEIKIPLIGDTDANSATAVWATTMEATGTVFYGLSEDTLNYTLVDTSYSLYHEFLLSSLNLNTIYYCKFASTNKNGVTLYTDIMSFITGKEKNITVSNLYISLNKTLKSMTTLNFESSLPSVTEFDSTIIPDADEPIIGPAVVESLHIVSTGSINNIIGTDIDFSVT